MFVCVSGLGLWVVVVGKSLQLPLGCVPNEFIFVSYASVSTCKPGRQGFEHKGIENGEESKYNQMIDIPGILCYLRCVLGA